MILMSYEQNWTQKIRGIPKEGKLEEMLKKSNISCSSATFMTNMNKYHFYGQDVYFLEGD